MTEPTHYDAIVIGAGQAGGPLASALAEDGRSTALIEREHAGGTCINEGCTPTKTMVASGRVAYLTRRARDFGVNVNGIEIDQKVVRQRKRDIVESFRANSEQHLKATPGLDLIFAEATFSGPKSLRTTAADGLIQDLTGELIFIDAGARPAPILIDGIDQVPYFDSTSIMELDETPSHLIVLGGGYIGLEFAQMFHRFGSDVTVIQHGSQLMDGEDEDIATCLQEILEQDGLKIMLRTEATSVRPAEDGIELTVQSGKVAQTVSGSHLLVATGRTPNSDRLNLSVAGIKSDSHGYITVNERLETSAKGIYALGDINGGRAFTHISYDDFRIVRDNLLHGGSRTTGDRPVPYVMFTDPELGRVGLSEREAKELGVKVRVASMPMSSVARTLEAGESRGMMKVLVDARSDQIVGAAVLGLWGGEIVSQIQLAMMGSLPYPVLRDGVFAHPTLAESLSVVLSSLD